jgi:ribose transport system permease protein
VIQAAPVTVMAVGMVFVLSAGEIDLSIGSVVALSALVTAVTLRSTDQWLLAAAAGLVVGALVGLLNGLFVTMVRLPSFLVTLATMGLVAGLARQLTDLQSVPVTNATFVSLFGGGSVLGIPILIWWTAVAIAVGWMFLRQRRYGAHVLAVGNNSSAARVSGIKVNRVRLMVLVGSAMTAALAGLLYAGRLQGARYTLGEADLMTVIAAAIVGGTSLFGGKGSVVGALIGSLLMSMLNNGLVLAGLTVSQQMIARAIIILIAVSFSLRGKKSQ